MIVKPTSPNKGHGWLEHYITTHLSTPFENKVETDEGHNESKDASPTKRFFFFFF
jgi:hypothetical protein